MAALVDTNVLVYRFDSRFPEKQRVASRAPAQRHRRRFAAGAAPGDRRVRGRGNAAARGKAAAPLGTGGRPQAEELIGEFVVLYPTEGVLRTALRGAAAYGLSWFDAHLWAYAEHYGLNEILSEDFQHDRLYGTVRAVNPFR